MFRDVAYPNLDFVPGVLIRGAPLRINRFHHRQGALELERLRETRRAEEEAWFRQQQLLLEAEEQRRKTLSLEEERLTDQRTRLGLPLSHCCTVESTPEECVLISGGVMISDGISQALLLSSLPG